MLGRGRKNREEFDSYFLSLRGQLDEQLFNADPGHKAYAQRAADLTVEVMTRARDLRVGAPVPKNVETWLERMLKSMGGWDEPPLFDAAFSGAIASSCEDWRAVDRTQLDSLVEGGWSEASKSESGFEGSPSDALVVLACLTWDPDLDKPGISGFEPLAAFVRSQDAYRRLAGTEPEQAELSILSYGLQLPGDERARFEREHRLSWNVGAEIGFWNELGRLPAT